MTESRDGVHRRSQELGDRCDWRSYHDTVPGGGSVPLPILDARARRWIAQAKASQGRVAMERLNMRTMFVAAALAFVVACSPAERTPMAEEIAAESQRITEWFDAQFEEELMMSPERLTSLGRKALYGQLDDRSEAAADRELEWRRQSVAQMKAQFDRAKLDDITKTSWDIWDLSLDRAEEAAAWRRHGYQFARGGPHTGIPTFMINLHRVDEPDDMEAYISRLSQIDEAIDQAIERAQLAAAQGVRPPAFARRRDGYATRARSTFRMSSMS
jgi:uncharacterized protein (DUF885 family)